MSDLTEEEMAILNAKPSDEPDRAEIKWPKTKKWTRKKTRTTLQPKRPHPGTKEAREILITIRRSLNVCEGCGVKSSKLHVHHKNRNPYDNDPPNLMVLCEYCHSRRHDVDESLQEIKEEDYALEIIDEEA